MFIGTMNSYLDSNHLSCKKNWTPTPSASGSYDRQTDRLAGWQTKYGWILKSLESSTS